MTYQDGPRVALTKRLKADRRRRRLKPTIGFCAVWVTRLMAAAPEEVQWRLMLLEAPDDRSLTGRLMGDPRWGRSALYHRSVLHQTNFGLSRSKRIT